MVRLLSCLLLWTATTVVASEPQPEIATGRTGIKAASATEYMAVTANPHATKAAIQMLAKGGTAVDATIAAQLVLGLVEPQSSGIGGGALILSYRADHKKTFYYDGRETAPMAVDENYFMRDGKPRPFMQTVIGGYSVGVPGLMRVLELAHQRDGKLPWKQLFTPAIDLAESGFKVSTRLHQLLKHLPQVAARPAIKRYFFNTAGEPYPVGYMLKNPAYAQTLRTLANKGAEAFYQGDIARAIVDAVSKDAINPGRMTLKDLAGYRAEVRQPLCSTFLNFRVCGASPPSSGGTTVGAILGMLQQFPLQNYPVPSVKLTHLFTEASELAFADRNAYLGDPDFVSVPTEALVAQSYLTARAKLINPNKAEPASAGKPLAAPEHITAGSPEMPNTSHLVIVDQYGNGVSMTTTIETGFGSRLMVGGFLLNNQLTDFSFTPSDARHHLVANRIQPGKRPRSSMSPTIVFNQQGDLRLLVGSPGGSRIIDYTARTILYHLAKQMPIAEAIAAGNIAAIGRNLEIEPGTLTMKQIARLKAMGHSVVERDLNSGIHAIALIKDTLYGGADPRREGNVAGR